MHLLHGQLASFTGAGCSVLCSLLRLGFDVEAFAHGGLDLGKVVSNGFPNFEVWQHSIAGEFVDGAEGQPTMGCDFMAGFLLGKNVGSDGERRSRVLAHAEHRSRSQKLSRFRVGYTFCFRFIIGCSCMNGAKNFPSRVLCRSSDS